MTFFRIFPGLFHDITVILPGLQVGSCFQLCADFITFSGDLLEFCTNLSIFCGEISFWGLFQDKWYLAKISMIFSGQTKFHNISRMRTSPVEVLSCLHIQMFGVWRALKLKIDSKVKMKTKAILFLRFFLSDIILLSLRKNHKRKILVLMIRTYGLISKRTSECCQNAFSWITFECVLAHVGFVPYRLGQYETTRFDCRLQQDRVTQYGLG